MDENHQSVNLLNELDSLSKMHVLDRETIDGMMVEFAIKINKALRIERISVWLFNQEKNLLISIGEYDDRDGSFLRDDVLTMDDFPNYFKVLTENRIIIAKNRTDHPFPQSYIEKYVLPKDIISSMSIPIRIGGELIGVMSFEKTGKKERVFKLNEQTFAFSIALVFASNLEARQRRAAQSKLQKIIKEKDLLIREMNHRIKNNFSILISLIRISKQRIEDRKARAIFADFEKRTFSMLKIHDLLHQSGNYSKINLAEYIEELLTEFKNTYPLLKENFISKVDVLDYVIDSKQVVHIGLLITEIFLNALKYAEIEKVGFLFTIALKMKSKNYHELTIGDNGKGFDFLKKLKKETLGVTLIKDLVNDLNYKTIFPTTGNAHYRFSVPK